MMMMIDDHLVKYQDIKKKKKIQTYGNKKKYNNGRDG